MTLVISFEKNRMMYVEGNHKSKKVVIKDYAAIEFTEDVLRNSVIEDKEAFINKLIEFKDEFNLKNRFVNVVLNSSGIMFGELTVPLVKEKEIREIVYNEILYSFGNLDDYTIDYIVLEKNKLEKKCRVLVFALSSKLLADYLDCFDEAGINCKLIDIAPNSIAKLTDTIYDQAEDYIVLQLYDSSMDIHLIEKGVCILFRIINLNIDMLIENQSTDILVEEIYDHINKILQFQKAKNKDNDIKSILIISQLDIVSQITEQLSNLSRIPCELYEFDETISGVGIGNITPFYYSKVLGGLIKRR